MNPNGKILTKLTSVTVGGHDLPNSLLLGDPLAHQSFESEWIYGLLSTFKIELPQSVRSLLSRSLARIVWNYWWLDWQLASWKQGFVGTGFSPRVRWEMSETSKTASINRLQYEKTCLALLVRNPSKSSPCATLGSLWDTVLSHDCIRVHTTMFFSQHWS